MGRSVAYKNKIFCSVGRTLRKSPPQLVQHRVGRSATNTNFPSVGRTLEKKIRRACGAAGRSVGHSDPVCCLLTGSVGRQYPGRKRKFRLRWVGRRGTQRPLCSSHRPSSSQSNRQPLLLRAQGYLRAWAPKTALSVADGVAGTAIVRNNSAEQNRQ